MITLYFHPLSNPSLYPLFVASAAGLEVERQSIDLSVQEQKSDSFLKVNPFGRVPALVDGDFALGESASIARYLARTSGGDIYSEDIREAALIDQWVDFVAHHIRVNVARINYNRFIAPMIGVEPDQASVDLGIRLLGENLPHLEVALDHDGHLHGERLTLADLALVAAFEPEKVAQIDLSAAPVTTAWLKKMRQQDWYTNVHSHYGAELGL
ncbi:glutathione S-transferase family protein [Algimonas porphyrae]|uniref:Glutathione S-transferase n=1 Tax=Algimonas porphyrae TaxID=1128113 RepID=A0ABQ5V5A7_9PROT|nr:glutathione S-transferase family protein [Algimonas porphyrae]GLQ21899.1 glutathione S-transferase [Algimonas porphyrae]